MSEYTQSLIKMSEYADLDSFGKNLVKLKLERKSNTDIAIELGMCRNSIIKKLKDETVKSVIGTFQLAPIERLLELQDRAIDEMIHILDDSKSSNSDKINVIKEILKSVNPDVHKLDDDTAKIIFESITKKSE